VPVTVRRITVKKLLLALLLLPIIAAAQDLTGDWTALLHYSAQIKDKSVVLHFSRSRNGTLAGNLRGTSPVFFIAVDSIVVRDGQVGFKFSTGSAMATHSTNFDPLAGVTLPPDMSSWDVSVDGGAGRVGMKGSIWVDPEGPDLRRVEIRADQIPSALPVDGLVVLLSYGRTTIGDRTAMIPDTAEMHLREKSGRENLNAIEFTHCRAFHAESALRFEASSESGAPPLAPPAVRPVPTATLPAGLRIAISLTTPVTDQTTVGSFIEGEISGNVASSGPTLLPAGAKVRGRVRRLERYSSKEGSYFVVALEFTDLDSARFFADFETVDRAEGVPWSKTFRLDGASGHDNFGSVDASVKWETSALPGVGAFVVRGSTFKIPAGFRTIWKTRSFSDCD
jgi:hypothetical protein